MKRAAPRKALLATVALLAIGTPVGVQAKEASSKPDTPRVASQVSTRQIAAPSSGSIQVRVSKTSRPVSAREILMGSMLKTAWRARLALCT